MPPTPNSVRAESNNSYSGEKKKHTAHRDDDDDDDNNNNNYNNNNSNNNNNNNNNIKFLYLPSSVFIALMLVPPCKCLKQIIQIKLNRVKNPNCPEANQLAFYKHGRGFKLANTMNKSRDNDSYVNIIHDNYYNETAW